MSVYKFGGESKDSEKLVAMQQELDALKQNVAQTDIHYDVGYQKGGTDRERDEDFFPAPMIAERKMELTNAVIFFKDEYYIGGGEYFSGTPQYWQDKKLSIFKGVFSAGKWDYSVKHYLIRGDMHSYIKIPLSIILDANNLYSASLDYSYPIVSRAPATKKFAGSSDPDTHMYLAVSIKLCYRYVQ